MKVFLTPARVKKMTELAQFFRRQFAKLMPLTQLLGLLVANMEALQWGRLHTRELQWFLVPTNATLRQISTRSFGRQPGFETAFDGG